MTETILEEAARITSGDRQQAYSHPRDHFSVTVGLINARFGHKLLEPFKPWEWAVIMVLDKVARGAMSGEPPKRDSLVDVAGYARTCEMLLPGPAVRESEVSEKTGQAAHACSCHEFQCQGVCAHVPDRRRLTAEDVTPRVWP